VRNASPDGSLQPQPRLAQNHESWSRRWTFFYVPNRRLIRHPTHNLAVDDHQRSSFTEIGQRHKLPVEDLEFFGFRRLEDVVLGFGVHHDLRLAVWSHKDIEDLFSGPELDRFDNGGRWKFDMRPCSNRFA
jgi:hypothetical protein